MQKKKFYWAIGMPGILSIVLLLVTACGPTISTSTVSTSSTVPPGEKVYVLDGYTPSAPQSAHIIGFHPGESGASPVMLPAGLISQDHQSIYTATPRDGHTTITITNTQTGATTRTMSIAGTYSTADQNYTQAVMSFDGHWLALRQQAQASATSTIALIDTQSGKLTKTIQLNGDFDLDAISPDGSNLYLLERLHDAAGHYHVRLYQVNQNQLYEYPIIDKQDLDPTMLGSALTRQMAIDGTVAYTLYTDTAQNIAFVHILPLDGTGFPFARCINLPKGKSANLLRYYSLKLSSDGSTLYAANGALGVVTAITNIGNDAQDAHAATLHFDAGIPITIGNDKTVLHNGAVLSPDQHTLYFIGVRGIWTVDTTHFQFKGRYAAAQPFTGIALSSDGQTLYGVYPGRGMTLIQVASGQSQSIVQSPLSTPWGIEWISH